jgi:hypothetical protein
MRETAFTVCQYDGRNARQQLCQLFCDAFPLGTSKAEPPAALLSDESGTAWNIHRDC